MSEDVVYSGILFKVALCVSSNVEAAAFVESQSYFSFIGFTIYIYTLGLYRLGNRLGCFHVFG